MFSIILAILAVLLAVYYHCIRERNTFKRHGIPYIKPMPFLGNTYPMLFRQMSFAELSEKSYQVHSEAKYVGLYDIMTPVIMLRDPELFKTVLVKNFDHFPEHRSFASEDLDPLFTKNLFSLRGDRWKEVRNLMTPVFTTSKMKGMFKLMVDCGEEFGKYLAELPSNERATMNMKDAFARYTNDVIATCAFGVTVNSMKDRTNAFYEYGREATNFSGLQGLKFFFIRSLPTLSKLLGVKLIRTHIANFFHNLVSETMKVREEQGIVRPDVIQQLMENKTKADLSLADITAQAFIFFFGGFDSTSTLMCFAAHELAANPDIQQKVREEIDQVLDETNGHLTYEALNNMTYLDAVVNEALRMYPIAVFSDRRCIKRYELPPALPGAEPYVLEPGSYIWYPIYGIQRDPVYFPEPNKFRPERFIDDPNLVNCGAYVPFGIGPRMCIGNRFALLEIKTLLFHVLAHCELKPSTKTVIPIQLSKSALNMTAEHGFWLSVEPRKNPHPLLTVPVANGTARS